MHINSSLCLLFSSGLLLLLLQLIDCRLEFLLIEESGGSCIEIVLHL